MHQAVKTLALYTTRRGIEYRNHVIRLKAHMANLICFSCFLRVLVSNYAELDYPIIVNGAFFPSWHVIRSVTICNVVPDQT